MNKSVTCLSGRDRKQTNRRIAFAKIQLCVGLVSLAAPAWVQAVETDTPSTAGAIKANLHTFNIGKQQLYSALNAIAEQGGVQFVYTDEMVKGLSSPGVSGQLTTEDALNKVLEGSGLGYRFSNGNTITLERKPAQASSLNQTDTTTLPKVNVVGNAVYDAKDPYNEDYVLPNATAGTKTDTPIMETPLNIQVISKQVLKDQQVTNLEQALKNVSGVTYGFEPTNVSDGGTARSITLRGFASQAYLRNGFRILQGSSMREMANVENVEVLKGSSAILYGQVEPGGMVNIITKQPLATHYYSAQQQFGSYNMYRTTIDTSGPIADNKNVLYRMNFSYENSGSFQDFVNNEKIFVAPVLKWIISDKTQANFELEYNHDNLGFQNQIVPTLHDQLIQIPLSYNYGSPGSKYINDSIFGSINWSHMFNENWSIKHSMTANHQILNSGLVVSTASPVFSPTGDKMDNALFQWKNENDTYATNLDLIGKFDTYGLKHTLLLGGDYYRTDYLNSRISSNFFTPTDTYIDIFNPVQPGYYANWNTFTYMPIPSGTPNNGLTLDPNFALNATNRNNNDQYGLYMQDQIKLPYNLHLTTGFRYQYIHQESISQNVNQLPTGHALTADRVTPRVGLLWQPQQWLSLYSNYTQSFGANYTGATIYPNNPPPPTSSEQWEIGTKTEFFDGRLRATLAYYDLTKTNVISNDPNPQDVCGGGACSVLTGAVRSRGPELDIQGEILPGWNTIATYSNTDIIVTKGNTTVGNPDYPAVGSRYFGVPRNTGSFWNTYEFQDQTLKGLKFGGGVTLRDGMLGWGSDNISRPVPGYITVDLMSSYSLKIGNSKVSAQLNVNNLLDKYYYTSAAYSGNSSLSPGGYSAAYVNFGMPRSLMGSIKVEF